MLHEKGQLREHATGRVIESYQKPYKVIYKVFKGKIQSIRLN